MSGAAAAPRQDVLQERMATFAVALGYETLGPASVEAAKARVADTVAALYAGFPSDAARRARAFADAFPNPRGATILGTRRRVGPEIAAFVNATTSREAEWNDVYMSRGGGGAHPSDVILPLLGVAEFAGAGGRDLLVAVAVAYDIYLGLSDVVRLPGFDQAVLAGIAVAAASGRLLGLTRDQVGEAIAICAVANNPLIQTRRDRLSMWKAAAAGQAAKAGVTAALMARSGIEGPSLPFAGTAGWNALVAGNPYEVGGLDPSSGPYRIGDSLIKPRASCAVTISSIFAAEDAARTVRAPDVERVVVETYAYAVRAVGSGEQRWNPQTRETADHSIPYVVAAALRDGSVGPRQFKPDRLWDPELRALMPRVEVVADDAFTRAYEADPREHHTRVTVTTRSGETVTGLAGGPDREEMGRPRSPRELEEKFLSLSRDHLGDGRARAALDRIRRLDEIEDVGELPPLLAL